MPAQGSRVNTVNARIHHRSVRNAFCEGGGAPCAKHPVSGWWTVPMAAIRASTQPVKANLAVALNNPGVQVIEVSARTGAGIGQWCDWLLGLRPEAHTGG